MSESMIHALEKKHARSMAAESPWVRPLQENRASALTIKRLTLLDELTDFFSSDRAEVACAQLAPLHSLVGETTRREHMAEMHSRSSPNYLLWKWLKQALELQFYLTSVDTGLN